MLNRPGRATPNLSFVVVWPGFLDQAGQLGGICAAPRALLVTCIAARFCCLSRDEYWRELRKDSNKDAGLDFMTQAIHMSLSTWTQFNKTKLE